MGQKQNPNALRLQINKQASSVWFAKGGKYIDNIHRDLKLRSHINLAYKAASIHDVLIHRFTDTAQVTISCARPGVLIGKKGADANRIKHEVENILQLSSSVTVQEFKKPDLSARLIADSIASQLERRVQFRKAMKRAVSSAMRAGAKGIKVIISGRLNGAEIARSESYHEGRVPLHTFKANIDYYLSTAKTTYGIIGVKVWVYTDDAPSSTSSEESAS